MEEIKKMLWIQENGTFKIHPGIEMNYQLKKLVVEKIKKIGLNLIVNYIDLVVLKPI